MRYIFVDFEMNPIDKRFAEPRKVCKQEIIEIGAVMLDDRLEEISEFLQYVKPMYGALQPIIRRMTRIRPSMLAHVPRFRGAMSRFLDWCGEDCRLFTWGPNDLPALRNEVALKSFDDPRLEAFYPRWEDFQETFVRLVGLSHRVALKDAVNAAVDGFSGRAHDALWDARNTAELFRLSRDSGAFEERAAAILEALEPPASPDEPEEAAEAGPEQEQEPAEEEGLSS